MSREPSWLRLAWSLMNGVQLVAILLWTAFWISIALAVALVARSPRPSLALARRVWAPGVLALSGVRLVVRGTPHLAAGGAYFVVANHCSWMDIPALFSALPFDLHFLAKSELERVPFLGRYIRAMGMVFVDRQGARRASVTVSRAAELLQRGKSVVSFPEGTRSRDGELGRFKPGGFGAAIEAGTPILPVALRGTYEILPADTLRGRPGVVEVVLGSPLAPPSAGSDARAALARECEAAVRALLSPTHEILAEPATEHP